MPESLQNSVRISVVIAAYNSAGYIRETLDSVLAQTFPPLEVIVVDDGSTDETAAIVRTYAGRVRLLQQENRGEPASRNRGIREAQGDYIAFIDADDLWLPEKLERQAACIMEKRVAWVSCGADFFEDSTGKILASYRKKYYEGDVLEKQFEESFILSPTPVIKKSVFDEIDYFDESAEARIGEDWDMWMRIAAIYPLGMVRQVLALKREHPASMMSSTSVEEKLRLQTLGIERAVTRQPKRLGPLKNKLLSKVCLNHGSLLLKQEQYDRARPLIVKSLQYHPYNLKAMAYWLLLSSGEVGIHIYSFLRKR
jgi:glycosyltransferase involved in cell wall biosynthesis